MEHEHEHAQEQADRLEAQADELEEKKDEFGADVEDVKDDWRQKQESAEIPGAQDESGAGTELGPETGERSGGPGGEASDRGERSEADPDGEDEGSE